MQTTDDIEEVGPEAIDGVAGLNATLRAMIRDGALAYVENAPVVMKALVVDGLAIPIVIGRSRRSTRDLPSDVCSPSAHYADYTGFELARRSPRWARPLLTTVLRLYAALLAACRIDEVVYVDNWLLATNPVTPLSEAQLRRVTRFLRARYPHHAIVHRSVNPALNRARCETLRAAGHRLLRSRVVYVLRPGDGAARRHSNVAIDRGLLSRSPLRLCRDAAPAPREVPVLAALYRGLYLGKHSPLNPAFNERFFAQIARDPFFRCMLLRDEARVRGFMVLCTAEGHVLGVVMGYDLAAPRKLGLYRQLIAAAIVGADEAGLAIDLSGGAGEFKRLRGAEPCTEYDAVALDHLPWWRRLPWYLVDLQGRLARALSRGENAGLGPVSGGAR